MKILVTERLLLRAFNESDTEDVFTYAKNPAVGPPAGWQPHASREESLGIVRMFMQKDEVWAIVERAGGRVIGSIGLHRDSKRDHSLARAIGYAMAEDCWGRGLATEAAAEVVRFAFEEMGLSIVSAVHFPFNARSRRVIEKLGFRYEGTIRMATPAPGGEAYDDMCYSLTRAEFEAARARRP